MEQFLNAALQLQSTRSLSTNIILPLCFYNYPIAHLVFLFKIRIGSKKEKFFMPFIQLSFASLWRSSLFWWFCFGEDAITKVVF